MSETVQTVQETITDSYDDLDAFFKEPVRETSPNEVSDKEKIEKTEGKKMKEKKIKDNKEKKNEDILDVSWAKKLSTIPDDGLEIEEFGKQKYFFQRVNIKEKSTDYYLVFCKIGDSDFKPLTKGLLSSRYTVMKLEDYFKEIISKYPVKEDSISVRYNEPFYLDVTAKIKSKDSENIFSSEEEKSLFSFLTGSTDSSPSKASCSSHIRLINTYDGSRKLTIDYDILISFGNSQFRDIFTLYKYRTNVIHSHKISEQISSEDIMGKYKEEVEKLKSIKNVDKIQKEVSEKLPKEAKKQFDAHWAGAVGDFNNLYYMLLLLSSVLESVKLSKFISIDRLVRSKIESFVKK